MKKFRSIFLSMAALLFAASCQVIEEYKPQYKPGTPDVEGCQKVYFPSQDLSAYEYLSPEAECVFEVTIARELDEEAVVVPVEVDANVDDIFQFDDVRFEAGQKETTFQVTFDKAEIGKLYTATFSVKDPNFASKYSTAPTFIQFKTMRVEWKYFTDPAGNKAKFTFDQMPFWEEIHTGYVKYYEVEGVRYCVTETDPVEDPEGNAYGFWGTAEAEGEGEVSFVWYPSVKTAAGNQAVLVNNCPVWYASNYGETVYRWDWFEWWTIKNPQAALAGMSFPEFVSKYEGNYPVSYYDGNGTFVFHAAYYNISAGNFTSDLDDVYLIADGFTRIDYSLEVETEYSYEGVIPFYVQAGVDVATVKVAGFEGKIDDKAVTKVAEQMASGEIESDGVELDEDNWGYATLEFESTGYYTLVAIGLNSKDELVSSASLQAFYVSADEEEQEKYKVKAMVGLEAVPARYEMDEYTTAAFYVQGHDITECHLGLFQTSISSLTESEIYKIFGDVMYDTDEEYTLNAKAIEAINGEGGLYDYFTGLKDGKTYSLVVWLTNGSLDTILYDEYTTPKMPYEWNLLGEGSWSNPINAIFGEKEPLVHAVKIYQEKNDPGLYMFTGFQKDLADWYYGKDTAKYKGTYWDDTNIVFDATDPNKVTIDSQDMGVYFSGYGQLTLSSINGPEQVFYGKLADGHLTFKAKDYFFFYGSKGWYGPAGFDLAFPSAPTKAAPTKVNYVEKPVQEARVMTAAPETVEIAKAEKIAIEREVKQANVKVVTSAAPAQKKPSKVNGKSFKIAPSRATESIVK